LPLIFLAHLRSSFEGSWLWATRSWVLSECRHAALLAHASQPIKLHLRPKLRLELRGR